MPGWLVEDFLNDVKVYGVELALIETQATLDRFRTDYPDEWMVRRREYESGF